MFVGLSNQRAEPPKWFPLTPTPKKRRATHTAAQPLIQIRAGPAAGRRHVDLRLRLLRLLAAAQVSEAPAAELRAMRRLDSGTISRGSQRVCDFSFVAFCMDVRTLSFCQLMGFPLNH